METDSRSQGPLGFPEVATCALPFTGRACLLLSQDRKPCPCFRAVRSGRDGRGTRRENISSEDTAGWPRDLGRGFWVCRQLLRFSARPFESRAPAGTTCLKTNADDKPTSSRAKAGSRRVPPGFPLWLWKHFLQSGSRTQALKGKPASSTEKEPGIARGGGGKHGLEGGPRSPRGQLSSAPPLRESTWASLLSVIRVRGPFLGRRTLCWVEGWRRRGPPGSSQRDSSEDGHGRIRWGRRADIPDSLALLRPQGHLGLLLVPD